MRFTDTKEVLLETISSGPPQRLNSALFYSEARVGGVPLEAGIGNWISTEFAIFAF